MCTFLQILRKPIEMSTFLSGTIIAIVSARGNIYMLSAKNRAKLLRFTLPGILAVGILGIATADADAQGRGRIKRDDRRPDVYRQDDDRDRRDRDYRPGGYYGDRDDRYNGRDRRGNQSLRFAYERGYRDGFKDGKKAAKRHSRDDNYGGNNRGWGRDYRWQAAYREGYRDGFRDGYNRNRRSGDRYNGRIFGLPFPF